ncbi:ribosome maturation factor RimM [Fodinibius sediminis]|uniref:Ribosome maturation factor RimM n=1 Tax=Fodinibius sediminis TaxID=1214077 RepID=A0A521AP06_9BACT|nr:ribosome maturation factor RimM [Fodinibius sediminis]SMO36543.1 16S rRNA processing protein RimM [Fodinibius sediminis]
MLESIENQYRKIGYIARSHGVGGDVLMISEIYAPTLFDSLDLVWIENARGDLVPARIESVRVQEKNNRLSFFVKFEHVTDRTQADALKQFSVYARHDQVDHLLQQEDETMDMTSYEIWVDHTRVGSVEEVIPNPAHPILRIRMHDQQQLLVPLVEEYVTAVDEERQQIQCQNLEQLMNL